MADSKTRTTSIRFNKDCGGDSVAFSSSDGILFYVHKKNLEFCSGGFPPAETSTPNGEIVPLTEKASTLELLFAFVYPQRHPGLNDMSFEELLDLAEAAEKYEVYFAMSLCTLKMKEYVSGNAPEIFGFAARHDYPFLTALVAPRLINKPLTDVVEVIPEYMYLPWTLYKERWQNCIDRVCSFSRASLIGQSSHSVHDGQWHLHVDKVMSALRSDVSKLTSIDTVFEETGIDVNKRYCDLSNCRFTFAEWRDQVAVREVTKIPDFVTFLKTYASPEIEGK